MKCLLCESVLNGAELDATHVEHCPGCGGIWLDHGELDGLVAAEDEDVRWMEMDLWGDALEVRGSVSQRECPNGHGRLAALMYGKSDIEVDVCPICGGVWLDAGELEKIVDYLTDKATSLSLPGYIQESLAEAKELISGGRGRASEWKDLKAVLRMMRMRLAVDHPAIAAIVKSLPR